MLEALSPGHPGVRGLAQGGRLLQRKGAPRSVPQRRLHCIPGAWNVCGVAAKVQAAASPETSASTASVLTKDNPPARADCSAPIHSADPSTPAGKGRGACLSPALLACLYYPPGV